MSLAGWIRAEADNQAKRRGDKATGITDRREVVLVEDERVG
jgi:hypothetical protein